MDSGSVRAGWTDGFLSSSIQAIAVIMSHVTARFSEK
jgi:hypothetical protein